MPLFSETKTANFHVYTKRLVWAVSVVALLAVAGMAIAYQTAGYESLRVWFLSLDDCFYRREYWDKDFFTTHVKTEGNRFAAAALAIALTGLVYLMVIRRRFQADKNHFTLRIGGKQVYSYVAAAALGGGLWLWGNGLVKGSTDELFSAVNCAEGHPFVTLAYYMLPNNHIYFNFINGMFFGWIGDLVLSARLISLIAYCGVLVTAFRWLLGFISNKWLAFLCLLPIALQFTVWGFSFQGRGYELLLFCCWMSFLTMWRYGESHAYGLLRTNGVVSVLGFMVLPTFLYFHFAMVVFMCLVQVLDRKADLKYWKYQLFIGSVVFLCYAPALCFSGYRAFTDNPFVRAAFPDVASFWHPFVDVIKYLINFCFSFIVEEGHPLNYILFGLPLLLLVLPGRRQRMMGLFFVVLCVTYSIIVLHMKRFPFNRNMIVHYSICMSFAVYTLYALVEVVTKRIGRTAIKNAVMTVFFVVPVVGYSAFLLREDRKNVALNLYFYDINELYDQSITEIRSIPAGAAVGCSYEAFYWYYYCRKSGCKVTFCPTGNEQYYLKRGDEPMPAGFADKYVLTAKAFSNYEVYKLK